MKTVTPLSSLSSATVTTKGICWTGIRRKAGCWKTSLVISALSRVWQEDQSCSSYNPAAEVFRITSLIRFVKNLKQVAFAIAKVYS